MQNTLLDCRIAAHCERKRTAGLGKASGPLQKRPSESISFREFPKGGPFFGSSPGSFMREHMKLPKKVMRKDGGHHIKVIAVKPSYGNVIQIALRLQFAESILLRTSSIMKIQDILHGRLLIGNDHLELIAVFMGNEQVELDGLLRLHLDPTTNKEETKATVPTFGFPRRVEIGKLATEKLPPPSALNHLLEFGETLKRHRDGELNAFLLKCPDDLIAEERAVHACLDDNAGAGAADYTNALQDEFKSAIGVMHIARAGKHIENLPRLCYRAEQRIITPLPLLLLVEADCCPFGLSARAQNRAIEIKRRPNQPKGLKSCKQHLPASLPKLEDTFVVNAGQGPADSRDVRKFPESQKTKHHEIVPIIVHVPKSPISQHQVHDQQKDNDVMTEYRTYRQMIKTGTQPGFHVQPRKQLLYDNQACKRSKPLILETKLRHFVDTGENLCFTRFHFQWPPALVDFAARHINFNQSGGRFAWA